MSNKVRRPRLNEPMCAKCSKPQPFHWMRDHAFVSPSEPEVGPLEHVFANRFNEEWTPEKENELLSKAVRAEAVAPEVGLTEWAGTALYIGGSVIRLLILVLMTAVLAGCGGRPDAYAGVPLDTSWDIRYSVDMPDHPPLATDGQWFFRFPEGYAAHVNYVTRDSGPVTQAETVTMVFRVDYDSATVFHFTQECPDSVTPASVYLMLQRRGDDMQSQDGRWWSGQTPVEQNGTTVTISVPLQAAYWTNVEGVSGSARADGFNSALANLGHIGMTFSGGCTAGHGLSVTGGKARFTLVSYAVK